MDQISRRQADPRCSATFAVPSVRALLLGLALSASGPIACGGTTVVGTGTGGATTTASSSGGGGPAGTGGGATTTATGGGTTTTGSSTSGSASSSSSSGGAGGSPTSLCVPPHSEPCGSILVCPCNDGTSQTGGCANGFTCPQACCMHGGAK